MVVSGIGGGALVGWVNIPHAAAGQITVAAPVPRVVDTQAATAERVAAAESTTTTTTTTATPPRPVAPPTTAAPVARPSSTTSTTEQQAVQHAIETRSLTPAATDLAGASSCGAAISYLEANSAPGFQFECPGYALGHQAMTCVNVAGVCPGERLIVISTVCSASYMNEAHNSWIIAGYRTGTIDPYGYCH